MGFETELQLAQGLVSFARQCEQAAALVVVEALWRQQMQRLGFRFAALGAHADPTQPDQATYVFHTYPEEWIQRFSSHRYHLVDPVFKAVEQGVAEFGWTDPEFLRLLNWRQRRILAEAQEFGLKFGHTHALASTFHLKASGSFVSDAPDLDEHACTAAKLINIIAHHRAAQICAPASPAIPQLRRRERQCLELCASGLDDEAIGVMLGISVATVRRNIESARLRLAVSSRTHAVARAIRSGQIKPFP